MKLMFASDLHGSATCCKEMIEVYQKEKAERLVLLGDLLYHGPRNDIPEGYEPKEVARMLNERKNELLCVRGNCDSEVDQMMLEFPILADYMTIFDRNRMFFITHGHKFNLETLPPIGQNDILIHGHTHLYMVNQTQQCTYINPGSVTIPKNGNVRSYMIYEDGVFSIKDFEGNVIENFTI